MKPAKTLAGTSSYGLEHFCEQEVGFYVSNGTFKGAMIAADIPPAKDLYPNALYRVRPLRNSKRTSLGLYKRTLDDEYTNWK